MRFDAMDHWDEDDYELARDYGDVSSAWQARPQSGVRMPSGLDARIRSMARTRAGVSVGSHWVFGSGPKLVLAVLLLFAVGVAVVMVQSPPTALPAADAPAASTAGALTTSPPLPVTEQRRLARAAAASASLYRKDRRIDLDGWSTASVRFSVDPQATLQAGKIKVKGLCVRVQPESECLADSRLANTLKARLVRAALAHVEDAKAGRDGLRTINLVPEDLD